MTEGYYILNGERFDVRSIYDYNGITGSGITKLVVQQGTIRIVCYKNQLTELIIPEGAKRVECERNKITQLSIPESVSRLDCDLMDGIEEQYRERMIMEIYQKR